MREIQTVRPGKRMVFFIGLTALVLLGMGTFINVWFGSAARQVVKDQFNEEQLIVARGIKYWIERQVVFLEREMLLVAKNLPETSPEPQGLSDFLQPCFDRVKELGVRKIELFDTRRGRSYTCYPNRNHPETTGAALPAEPGHAREGVNGPGISVFGPTGDGPDMVLLFRMGTRHPVFDVLSFQLNLSWFLTPFLKHVRSGKTGYAWIIDDQGRFLYHPQSTFVGRSAFEARKERDPDISQHQINTIQRENMLKGMEGAGSYQAAWHRGITGKIEKLIAYSPVIIADKPARVWSVAVVAPVYEIEDAVGKIQRWQALLQGLVTLVIITSGGMVLFFEIRLSRRLEQTVKDRTRALKRSEENYRSLVESAEDFIFTLDREGKLLSVNSFTAAYFGSHPEDLIGCGINSLFPEDIAARQFTIIRTVYDKGKSLRDEFELKVGDSETWISANFMPLKNETGRMNAVLCIARDITENKNLEKQLVNTEKLASLGTLAAGVAHEVNNPLGVILGFCDLLLQKTDKDSQAYQDLKTIERQGILCKKVIENLLSFSRVRVGSSETADLNSSIDEIISIVKHTLEMNDIELKVRKSGNIPPVVLDSRQLQQVFLNLINNAVAAMDGGGVLEILSRYDRRLKKAVVTFSDSGVGIPPENLDHIFEPFFTSKPEGEGTGLGLFVSYGIVSKYGGVLHCTSPTIFPDEHGGNPRGTMFTVRLPVRQGEDHDWENTGS